MYTYIKTTLKVRLKLNKTVYICVRIFVQKVRIINNLKILKQMNR